MNKLLIFFWLLLISIISCNNKTTVTKNSFSHDKNMLLGKWEREFETLPGKDHTASYTFTEDKITYELKGSTNAYYILIQDTFIKEKNFFIGHVKNGVHYLIAIKDNNDNSINLHKEIVENLEEGLKIKTITDTTEHGKAWYKYLKVKD